MAWVALAMGGCVEPSDFASRVRDLRVLAVQAEPPEVFMDSPAPQAVTVRLRALIGDAEGLQRSRAFRFAACARADRVRCAAGEEELEIARGITTGELAQAQFAPEAGLVQRARPLDSMNGFGGLPLLVTLRVEADREEVHAGKRLVVSWPKDLPAGAKPNRNPAPPRLMVNGRPLGEGEALSVPRDGLELDVAPPDAADRERWLEPTFDGGWIELTEVPRYSWFTSRGRFEPEVTGGWDARAQRERPTAARLVFDPEDEAGPLRVWVVVRDGRGGVAWTRVAGERRGAP